MRGRIPEVAIHTVACAALLALAILVYGHVFSNGLCCADDSYIAVVSKNLASGLGYTNSVSYDNNFGLRDFDPGISTGPTLVMPAAVLIALVGNLPWVPGFVTATASLALLIAIWFLLRARAGTAGASSYLAVLVALLYFLTAGIHFEHWYALLGEIPSALLCVTGAAVFASVTTRRGIVAAGLLLGLAFLTKTLAALGSLPFVVVLTWIVLGHRDRTSVEDLFAGLTAFLTPFLVFESWKLGVLGGNAYLQNQKDLVQLFHYSGGVPVTADAAFFLGVQARAVANGHALLERMGWSLLLLLVVALVSSAFVARFAANDFIRRFFALLMAGAWLHLLWWILLSNGRPRYALIGLFLYFSALACCVLVRVAWWMRSTATVSLLVVFFSGYARTIDPVRFVAENKFNYSPRVANLLKTVALLESLSADRPFVGGWWATVADIEYAMPSVQNFIPIDRVEAPRGNRQLILVRNEKWVNFSPSDRFTAWERRCDKTLLYAPPYIVSRCPARR